MGVAIDWNRIENFVGYGRVDAPVVFLGMEEGQSNPANLVTDLLHRSQFDPIMDLERAHEGIERTARYFDSVKGATQRTWRPMCHVMIRRQGAGVTPTLQSRLQYQALHLGRIRGDSLLTELLPYPKRTARAWPEVYRERFQTRALYERGIVPHRFDLLASVLAAHPRELIIGYGKSRWSEYVELARVAFNVDAREWVPALPVQGIHVASTVVVGNTRIVLVKHFCRSEFNTDAQLDRFADIAFGESPCS
jgi:hypothetical protein